jgi:hypothetical protein
MTDNQRENQEAKRDEGTSLLLAVLVAPVLFLIGLGMLIFSDDKLTGWLLLGSSPVVLVVGAVLIGRHQ